MLQLPTSARTTSPETDFCDQGMCGRCAWSSRNVRKAFLILVGEVAVKSKALRPFNELMENGRWERKHIFTGPPLLLFPTHSLFMLREVSSGYAPVPRTVVGEQNISRLNHPTRFIAYQVPSSSIPSIKYGDDVYKTCTAAVPQAILGLTLLLNNGAL